MAAPLMSLARRALGAPSAAVSPKRKYIALAVAAASDIAQMAVWPMVVEGATSPIEDAFDIATAVVLVLILGWNWRLAAAFATELVPGLDLFPTWTAMVLSYGTLDAAARALAPPAPNAALPVAKTEPFEVHDALAPHGTPPVLYQKRTHDR